MSRAPERRFLPLTGSQKKKSTRNKKTIIIIAVTSASQQVQRWTAQNHRASTYGDSRK